MAHINEITRNDVSEAHRFDADFFKIQDVIKKIENMQTVELQRISNWITQGPNPQFSVAGIPCLTGRNISNGQVILEGADLICESEYENLKRFTLQKGDILITLKGAGSTGKIALFNLNEKVIFSRNVGLIRLSEKNKLSRFVYTFLSSSIGQKIIDRGVTGGTGQLTLPTGFLKMIKIPLFSSLFQLKIDNIVEESCEKQVESEKLYREAEELLLIELGLLSYKVDHSIVFFTTKKEIDKAKRYDSEYFQPKYKEIDEKIEKYANGFDIAGKIINFKGDNFLPKEDVKYKYLALSNISNQGHIQDYQEELGKCLPTRARRKINTGDVIISSIEGSLTSCAIIEKEFDNAVCSTGFFVLNSQKINPETLLIIFKSNVIQELLKRGSKGTILTAISKGELEQIKIPLIKPQIQKQIAEKIQESHRLRKESKELLEQAKRMVEEEIEKDTKVR